MFSSLKLNRHWAVMVVGVLLWAGCLSEQENVLEVTKTVEPTSVAWVMPTATATATPTTDGYHSHHVSVEFRLKGDIVQIIGVDGGNRGEEFRPLFIRDWQSYSPSALLNRYDLPTYIEFAPVENSPYYRLELTYASLGIMITYIVPFERLENEEVSVCFNLELVDYIYMTLFAPNAENSTPYPVDDSIFWEVATGLDREAFRQMFLDTSTPPCVEVNR